MARGQKNKISFVTAVNKMAVESKEKSMPKHKAKMSKIGKTKPMKPKKDMKDQKPKQKPKKKGKKAKKRHNPY